MSEYRLGAERKNTVDAINTNNSDHNTYTHTHTHARFSFNCSLRLQLKDRRKLYIYVANRTGTICAISIFPLLYIYIGRTLSVQCPSLSIVSSISFFALFFTRCAAWSVHASTARPHSFHRSHSQTHTHWKLFLNYWQIQYWRCSSNGECSLSLQYAEIVGILASLCIFMCRGRIWLFFVLFSLYRLWLII